MVSKHKVVSTDTSCFIILDKISALHILNSLFSEIITTPEIAAEYGKIFPGWVVVQKVQNRTLQNELNDLVDEG